jgi:hypothetical protein
MASAIKARSILNDLELVGKLKLGLCDAVFLFIRDTVIPILSIALPWCTRSCYPTLIQLASFNTFKFLQNTVATDMLL